MNLLQNVVKGWITSVIGTIIILVALILYALGKIPFWPDACGWMFIGGVFLIAPDKFGGIVDAVVKKKSE